MASHWRWLIWGLALSLQLLRSASFFSHANADRNHQSHLATNLRAGAGISLSQLSPEDLSQVHYLPDYHYPPAYIGLIALSQACVGNGFLALELLHYLGIGLLFLGLKKWLEPQLSSLGYGAFWAFWALSFAPLHYAYNTDGLWAGAGFVWGMAWLWEALVGQKSKLWLASLAFGLALCFHFSYLPYVLLPLLAWGWIRPQSWTTTLGLGLWISLLGSSLWLWQQAAAGSHSYFDRTYVGEEGDFFTEHLLKTDPFPLKAFAYLDAERLAAWSGWPVSVSLGLMWLGSLVILMIWLGGRWQQIRQRAGPIWLMLTALGLNVGMLLVLSLFTPYEDWGEGIYWTYVQEERYFFPTMLLLQVGFFGLAFSREPLRMTLPWWRVARLMLGGVGLYMMVHTSFRVYERYGQGSLRQGPGSAFAREMQDIYKRVGERVERGEQVLYLRPVHHFHEHKIATWAGGYTLDALDWPDSLRSTQPLSVLLHCRPEEKMLLEQAPAFLPYRSHWQALPGEGGMLWYVFTLPGP